MMLNSRDVNSHLTLDAPEWVTLEIRPQRVRKKKKIAVTSTDILKQRSNISFMKSMDKKEGIE